MNIVCQFQAAINQPAVGAMMIEDTGKAIEVKLIARPRSAAGYQLTNMAANAGQMTPSASPIRARTASNS